MDGLLIKSTGEPATRDPSFWKYFKPIRGNLDRLAWCFRDRPWWGEPADFRDDHAAMMDFDGGSMTSLQLWSPGSLSRYADRFSEESIEMWGVDPDRHDPPAVAALYTAAPWNEADEVIRRHASVWMRYTDGACWEIYAEGRDLPDFLARQLRRRPDVEAHPSRCDAREEAFRAAGLDATWEALEGRG
ncbi:hypothetical protein [Paludisphaera soli]|uniref:hypothetical protein n=1 Tax=Paludisphaera soli TaxID=2712865 RepID=UPI0013EC800E|nr:hypothetical protein [Paludisphaera soli]